MATAHQRLRFHAPAALISAALITSTLIWGRCLLAYVLCALLVLTIWVWELRVVAAYRAGYSMAVHTTARSLDEGENLLPRRPDDVHPADERALFRAMRRANRDDEID